ncbi:MAG: iron-sulfur cluster assembly accessory protein [Candidatus Dasytiphilus stammeri]
MSISLTNRAAVHIRYLLERNNNYYGLRIGVKNSGCTGMAYVLELVEKLKEGDRVLETKGIKIILDAKSALYLNGTELDYVKEGLNESFQFNNPNVKYKCGCGKSFSIV